MEIVFIESGHPIGHRIFKLHLHDTVRRSLVRAHIASKMGYGVTRLTRFSPDGRRYVTSKLALVQHGEVEAKITEYLTKYGYWKCVRCHTWTEAKEFAKYAIERFNPVCNESEHWNKLYLDRYEQLLTKFNESKWVTEVNEKSFPFTGAFAFGFDEVHFQEWCQENQEGNEGKG